MSWIAEKPISRFQKLCINILKCGPIPNHIAFIMDGNRRYAAKTNVQKIVGHTKGFENLSECLQWCGELGVKEVTVYAFSIENFKRSKEEVDTLMNLAREKFRKLLEEKDKIMQESVCVRVIGNLTLLPTDLLKLIAEVVLLTKDNNQAVLNIAFSYTSRDEITHSVNTILEGVNKNEIQVEDVDEDLISSCMYTHASPNPDILIRTSGEVRLSDFLLWQTAFSEICFTDVLWPEFSIWDLLGIVFKYQRSYDTLRNSKKTDTNFDKNNQKVNQFLRNLRAREISNLELFVQA